MNLTVTTEELLALSKSADLLRQTAEKAMRFDEAERLLTEHIRSWEKLHNAMTELDGNSTPKPLVDRVLGYIGDRQREAGNWEETARRHCRNEDFYRDLLDAAAIHLGKEAYTADDGAIHDSPIRLKIPGLVAKLAHENETLARNMPPEPPQSIFDTPRGAAASNPQPIKVCKVLGQKWCRTSAGTAEAPGTLGIKFRDGSCLVLCNVLQDTVTGALTYRPLAVEDLPLVP